MYRLEPVNDISKSDICQNKTHVVEKIPILFNYCQLKTILNFCCCHLNGNIHCTNIYYMSELFLDMQNDSKIMLRLKLLFENIVD